ncbi:ABC transporter ATP-binding protein [Candidatus Uhrbacteria bacterium]|nr:ABC transporter ATP-binding protein [Candidatus Uhrbacteria bacterium]
MLEVRDLKKDYVNGDVVTPVLRGVDLAIDAGEFVALMGPSGSGKSTLMHILGFLDRPTSGAYRFAGKDVGALTEDARAAMRRSDVGFVFQSFHLLPKLTALENVMLPALYADLPAAERETRARAALAEVGLSDRADFVPTKLSGGQKQRVAIARALINNPSVIFADEPTGNLDSASSAQVLELLRTLNAKGRTVVMVTHEAEAAAYARRTVRLRDGVIVL